MSGYALGAKESNRGRPRLGVQIPGCRSKKPKTQLDWTQIVCCFPPENVTVYPTFCFRRNNSGIEGFRDVERLCIRLPAHCVSVFYFTAYSNSVIPYPNNDPIHTLFASIVKETSFPIKEEGDDNPWRIPTHAWGTHHDSFFIWKKQKDWEFVCVFQTNKIRDGTQHRNGTNLIVNGRGSFLWKQKPDPPPCDKKKNFATRQNNIP